MTEVESLTVLLVEDEPGDRWLFSEVLRSRGHRVVACEDAESAWERFPGDPAPLLLLDLALPGMGGLELCRKIRATPEGASTVIVVVTGRDDPTVLEEVLAAGADDYLTKPVDVGTLNVRLAVAERNVQVQSERRRARLELAEKSRELEALFQNLDQVFFSVDLGERRLIQVSPASSSMLGYSPSELQEDEGLWKRLLFPPDLEAQQDALARLGPEKSLVHQYPVTRADGEERWIEAHLKAKTPTEESEGRVDGVLYDVTDRRRAQELLAARNRELATLFRISEVTLTAPNAEQAYGEILQEVVEAVGYPMALVELYDEAREVLTVVSARGLDLPEDEEVTVPLHDSLSGLAVRTGRPVLETEAHRREEHGAKILRDQGVRTILAFPMVVGTDVVGTLTLAHPESMEADDRTVRLATSMANTIASFTERIATQEALQESEQQYRRLAQQLQRANEELESFAYSVSHDLRAPLRTMQGFAHALLQNYGAQLPAEARDYAQRIIRSGERSEELISDLLSYSRLSFEEIELQPVDLGPVVDAAAEQLAGDLQARDAELKVDGPLPTVAGHQATLIQVLGNLFSNAVKFVPEDRTPVIEVRAEKRDGMVRLWVEDNGIGVPADKRDRIFRVFERLVEEGEPRPGTGIGLAVVRRGMERLGGQVGVEPRQPHGSAFWLDLPLVPVPGWRPWRNRRSEGAPEDEGSTG